MSSLDITGNYFNKLKKRDVKYDSNADQEVLGGSYLRTGKESIRIREGQAGQY